MGNCLVTKLKGVVDNDNLRKIGELIFYTDVVDEYNSVSNMLRFRHSQPITVRILEGDGFLVDSDMSSNPVKSKTLIADSTGFSDIYFTNSSMKLGVCDVKNVSEIHVSNADTTYVTLKALRFDFDECKYLYRNFNFLYLNYAKVTGNIKNILCSINAPYLPNEQQCIVNRCSSLYGNINDIDGYKVGGNGISNSTGIITGDIVQYLNSVKTLSDCSIKGINVHLVGDLSQLSSECVTSFITQMNSPNIHYTYTQSNQNRCQLCTEYVDFGEDLERYIIDMAAIAQTNKWVVRESLYYIMVYGTIDVTKPEIEAAINILRGKNLQSFTINNINYNS